MHSVLQLSVFLENKVGQLEHILYTLTKNNVDIYALNIAENSSYGVVRLIIKEPENVAKILQNEGFIVSLNDVYMVAVPNKLGGLNNIITIMRNSRINVEHMYSMIDVAQNQCAIMIFAVDNKKKMDACIDKYNVETLSLMEL